MAECGVCWEIFEEGAKCPKLLPCIHTVCISCLKELQTVNGNGKIRCPFCRTLHQIPRGQIEDLPTNQRELEKVTWKTNKIYTLPCSGKFPGFSRSSGIGNCEVHNQPLSTVIYNAKDGTQQRFCETCLSLNACVFPERESESDTGRSNCFRQFQGPYGNNGTRSGETGRVNSVSVPVQMMNYDELGQASRPTWQTTTNGERGRENNFSGELISYVELEPCPTSQTRQTTDNGVVENMEQGQSRHPNRNMHAQILKRIFKRLVFILCSPITISVGLLIAMVAIPIGVALCPLCTIYYFFRCRCCHLYDETYYRILTMCSCIFDKYAHLITRLFCWDVEDYDSRINQTCQIVALGVSLIVIGLYLAGLILGLIVLFIGSLVLWA